MGGALRALSLFVALFVASAAASNVAPGASTAGRCGAGGGAGGAAAGAGGTAAGAGGSTGRAGAENCPGATENCPGASTAGRCAMALARSASRLHCQGSMHLSRAHALRKNAARKTHLYAHAELDNAIAVCLDNAPGVMKHIHVVRAAHPPSRCHCTSCTCTTALPAECLPWLMAPCWGLHPKRNFKRIL